MANTRILGTRFVIQKDSDEFDLKIPKWIGEAFGELLIVNFDGQTLTVRGAPHSG